MSYYPVDDEWIIRLTSSIVNKIFGGALRAGVAVRLAAQSRDIIPSPTRRPIADDPSPSKHFVLPM